MIVYHTFIAFEGMSHYKVPLFSDHPHFIILFPKNYEKENNFEVFR